MEKRNTVRPLVRPSPVFSQMRKNASFQLSRLQGEGIGSDEGLGKGAREGITREEMTREGMTRERLTCKGMTREEMTREEMTREGRI